MIVSVETGSIQVSKKSLRVQKTSQWLGQVFRGFYLLAEGADMENYLAEAQLYYSKVHYSIPVSVNKHSFCASPCPAVQQQKLLSSP